MHFPFNAVALPGRSLTKHRNYVILCFQANFQQEGAADIDRKLKRIFSPGNRMFFILMILFSVAMTAIGRDYAPARWIAAVQILLVFLSIWIYRRRVLEDRLYAMEISSVIHRDIDIRDADLSYFNLPMMVIRLGSGQILWANEAFYETTGKRCGVFEKSITDLLPGFKLNWLYENHKEAPAGVTLKDRSFIVSGRVIHNKKSQAMAVLYFVDVTELMELRNKYRESRPVVCILLIDNYEECMKNLTDSQKSEVLAVVDKKVAEWASPLEGVFRKYDRDKHIIVFEERKMELITERRFSLLEDVRAVHGAPGVPVTMSLGIGKDAETLAEGFSFAQLAIDMALSRGGDRAVIKNRLHFEFYGGHSKEIEKRTKVKSRVMADSLSRLIQDSSRIFIMGHSNADIDCIGAMSGIMCIARKLKKEAGIVICREECAAKNLIGRMRESPEYKDVFTDDQDALVWADVHTLLVVVDCNRPSMVESRSLLEAVNRVAVIDHHRIGDDCIKSAALDFHEPYASSACELVCELVQNICRQEDILLIEAEAMLGGIFLDTKNFTINTGIRTFEAAAFLRRIGADTVEIKKLFQNDYHSSMAKHKLISSTCIVRRNMAIAVAEYEVSRTIAAQVADALLEIEGTEASFVIVPDGVLTVFSARSLGSVNVHAICEKLGGGGHQSVAGVQLENITPEKALNLLSDAIEDYCLENGIT
ncbi:MAG: DHH family phosphoesterase [Oscillospiraceae bacterium]|nr:DHH family phosphoesterase [Oscillospiraceae bacterium]